MKKIFRRIAAVLGLLLLSFLGYVWYKTYTSFNAIIPQNAGSVIRINTYGLIRSVAFSYITDPGIVFSSRKRKGPSVKPGVSIAANQFIYTIKDIPNTFFTTIGLTDSSNFNNYLLKKLNISDRDYSNSHFLIARSGDKKITIVFNRDMAAIAYSFSKAEVLPTLKDLLQQRNTVTVRNSRWKTMQDVDTHISFSDEANTATLNFEKGAVSATARVLFSGWEIPDHPQYLEHNLNGSISCWLNATPVPLFRNKTFSTRTVSLQGDSLLKSYAGYADFRISGTVISQDTIITYDYNDDFEKVEQKEIKSTQAPGSKLTIKANTEALQHYLTAQQVLTAGSDTISRTIFPLYRLYSASRDSLFSVGTSGTSPQEKSNFSPTDYFFGLNINFNDLETEKQFPLISDYIHPFRDLKVRAQKTGNGVISIDLKIAFDKADRHSLRELIDSF